MKKVLLASVLAIAGTSISTQYGPAIAADLPKRDLVKAAPIVASAPVYWFAQFGVGFSSQQNELTLQGFDFVNTVGTPKQIPTGFMAGAGVGVLADTIVGKAGFEAEVAYDFTRASIGCSPGLGCTGYSKNSWFLAQKVLWAPFTATPMAWTGWQWAQGLQLIPEAGIAERTLDACLLTSDGVTSACDTKWLVGWLVGVQARAPIGQSAFFKVEYNYIGYNQSVTHTDSPVFGVTFANTLKNDYEQRLMAGVGGYFSF